MKLSVIVPIYNAERYLRDCIESISKQSYRDLEILLIDDGSTDNSGSICDEYACRDKRIRVIHKRNSGVSASRNIGIKESTGDYILFVDADDWIDQHACKEIAERVQDSVALYIWNLKKCINENVYKQTEILKPKNRSEMIADVIAGPKEQNSYIRAVWAKVYSKKLIEDLRFDESMYIGEDACFLLTCLQKIESLNQILIIDGAWYNYRIIENSAVRRYKKDLLEQSIIQYQSIQDSICRMQLSENRYIRSAMTRFCWGVYFSLKDNSMKKKKGNSDCYEWERVTKKNLIDLNIEKHDFPKFQLLCWKLYPIYGSKTIEGLVGLYERYSKWKNKHHYSSI